MINRNRAYWLCQISGWLLYAAVGMAFSFAFQSFSWLFVAAALVNTVIGLVFTHGWRWQMRERGWLRLPLRSLIPRVVLASTLLAVVWVGLSFALNRLLFGPSDIPANMRGAVALVVWFNWNTALLIWGLLYCGVHFFENYRQAEVQKWQLEAAIKDAALSALKSQLNPHFLFNALNSIRALIVEDPARGQEAVTKLAGILRYSLQTGATELRPLRVEMQFVEDYLALEMIRFDERLRVEIQLTEAALNCAVPPMIVQTLVENGIKHGLSTRHQGGAITVRAWLEAEQLRIRVSNDGHLSATSQSKQTGQMGLQNATERLQLLFGGRAALTLAEAADNQVVADLTLPAQIVSGVELHSTWEAILELTAN